MWGSCEMVPNSILEDSTRPTVVVSEQRVRGGQVCDGGRHEVKKSRDIGLDPLLNLDYLRISNFGTLEHMYSRQYFNGAQS
jgi:hypothetical protein